MALKSIEIYYDISEIPNISDRSGFSSQALGFRNKAMEHIEQALQNANAGEWEGAEVGSGEVNFGFSVNNHDVAERIVRDCVAGTEFDCIREIQRREITDEEMAEMEAQASQMPQIKPMNMFEMIGMLVFRRMPKRFRQMHTDQDS